MQRRTSLRTGLLRSSVLHTASVRGRSAELARPARLSLAVALLVSSGAPAFAQSAPAALPAGGVFVSGSGQISQPSPDALSITQSGNRGVIDWRDFSIAAEHQVTIQNGSGATLNRVTGGSLSRLDGMLTATGSVYLMNPNGVIIGPGGKVTTGGDFVATTRNIDSGAFMAGGALAIRGTSDGAISNAGSIVSQGGSVVMIARAVTNTGSITAARGRVDLAAADEVLLTTIDGKADRLYVAVGGGRGDVSQGGSIRAAAASLQAAHGNVFALAGNREGLVQATGTETIDGQLWLTAPQGKVEISGALKASNADGTGGHVTVNGAAVALAGTADVAATGTSGGEVVIGASSYATGQGLAETTVIADGARITAGGAGGGGRIETSGKGFTVGAAKIDAGEGGQWLIDPDDLLIDAAAATTIVGALDGGTSVQQQTTAGGTGGSGDITVAAALVWTGSGNLTLSAYRDIAVNNRISGGGTVNLTAGRDIAVNAAVAATGVTSTATGVTTIAAGGISAAAGDITLTTGSFVNQVGAGALAASGRWLVYSGDPAIRRTTRQAALRPISTSTMRPPGARPPPGATACSTASRRA